MHILEQRVRWDDFVDAAAARKRLMVVSIVALLHIAAFMAWLEPAASVPELGMVVTMEVAAGVESQAPSQPPPKVAPSTPGPVAAQQDNVPEPAPSESPPAAAAPAPQAADTAPVTEPDYKAAYLNNRLVYPLAARRMGLQGRVVLSVEVLADGTAGQINVLQSSGHEVLDRAALESVRSWRFSPASRAGQPFTKTFTVPIQFLLQGSE